MKKILITACITMFTTLLMAGGDRGATLSPVANISNKLSKTCQTNKVYVEADAGLMWQDQEYTDAEDGAYKRNYSVAKAGKHSHAMNYCRTLNYAGYSDWRLPTKNELSHVHEPQGNPFIYHRGSDFWSSTPAVENKYYVIFPADATQYARNPGESNYIRCVRCLGEAYVVPGVEEVK